jgi:pimeloyl-ACP methyl ester carboxylesterase
LTGRRAAAVALSHVALRSGRGTLALTMAGEGRLVVFVHAGFCDRRMWWAQLGALADRFQVVAYDRRGFGESSPASEAHAHVRDLDVILEALDVDSAILVACSEGCRIAIDYAATHPERVDGLVLVSPHAGTLPPASALPDQLQRLVDEMELARRAGDIDLLIRLMAQAWLDGPLQAQARVGGNTRTLFLDMAAMALRRSNGLRETGGGDPFRRFRYLSQPAEIVAGQLDFPHVLARAQDMVVSGRRAHLTMMKGVAHLPGLEAPVRFNSLLKRLVKAM